MKELKQLFNEYQKVLEEINKVDTAWDKDPCNEELEKAFDEAYNKEFELYQKLQEKIVSLGSGNISKGTASTMINGHFEELEKLFTRIA